MPKLKNKGVAAKRKLVKGMEKNIAIIREINKREFESDFTNELARHSRVYANNEKAPKIIGKWSGKYWNINYYDDKSLTIAYKFKGKTLVNITLDDSLSDIDKKCTSKHAKMLEELRNRILNN